MDTDGEHNIYEEIGKDISAAQDVATKSVDQRHAHLCKAEEIILHQPGSSAVDNFLTEMLQFITDKETKIRCFVISFIEKACKKDPEVMKRAVTALVWPISEPNVVVQKKIINACTQLYPYILKWAAQKKSDKEVEGTWTVFSQLKQRIMERLDSENEGIRTMVLKFLEAVIICQTQKSEFSVPSPEPQMSLEEVSRDHSYISYRMLASEATFNFNRLLEEMASSHISSLNLITVISCLYNIVRQRPEHFLQVISALESLHVNLPPTLGTSQVKSVRKELKMHLMRLLKHPISFCHHHRINQLLIELGVSQSEIAKAMPPVKEVSEAVKRRLVAARTEDSASSQAGIAGQKRGGSAAGEDSGGDVDLRDIKRLKLDEDEYDDSVADIFRQLDDLDSATHATQKAVEITTDFVLQRLSLAVVTKLVIIALHTLPDRMPATFAASYTPIDGAGSEAQKKHLARMLAIQLTRDGKGPGIEYIKAEKQRLFLARQTARSEGAIIPPTPTAESRASDKPLEENTFAKPLLPAVKSKIKTQSFSLFTATKEPLLKEAYDMIVLVFKRIMLNEKRALQGGAGSSQQNLLIRLVSRFHSIVTKELEATLLNFIIEDQRTDLALLWLSELYGQLKGFTECILRDAPTGKFTEIERYVRYDRVLCGLLNALYTRGEHKETLFHRIFLEIPLITPASLKILKLACTDKVYGAFAITTLRELILTRPRQRVELLKLLLELSYFERHDIKENCVKTAKELYEIDYVREDVRALVVEMSELLVQPTAPKVIWERTGRFDRKTEESMKEMPWDESLIRAALHLFLALLPSDHTLLHQLASVCANASTEIKRVIFRCIEQAIKSIGMQSAELLQMIEECPEGGETLVARVVHLLTERSPPTVELVEKVRQLHKKRNMDVRSLIPILTGLEKEELLALIPKFVLSATYGKSVPTFFKKLLFGRHINTHEPLLGPAELLVELHRVKPSNFKEQQHLVLNLDLLLVDKAKEYNFAKDVYASAVESLLDTKQAEETSPPPLIFHTIQKIQENYPALSNFLSNVMMKIAQRKVWKSNSELWPLFVKCVGKMGRGAYMAIITQLTQDELQQCLDDLGEDNLKLRDLANFVNLLSAHQHNLVPSQILDYIKEAGKQ